MNRVLEVLLSIKSKNFQKYDATLLFMHFFLNLALLTLVIASCICFKRQRTRMQLSSGSCNLPTVCWFPKFINYLPEREEKDGYASDEHKKERNWTQKLSSSNITNILPRMERLNGPFGMYATVYGISTKVVHVAHPTPARAILLGENGRDFVTKSRTGFKKKIDGNSMGIVKNPGYNHFRDFFGEGVFTAEGQAWKAKRSSLIHCLLKGCTKDGSYESLRLETEANRAACTFISSICDKTDNDRNAGINVVPLLQRATIGLIYRLITHNDLNEEFRPLRFSQSRNERKGSLSKENMTVDFFENDSSFIQKGNRLSNSLESPTELNFFSSNHSYISSHNTCCGQHFIHDNNPVDIVSPYLDAVTKIRMIILAQSRSLWFLLPRWCYHTFSSMCQEEVKQLHVIKNFALKACQNAKVGSPLQMLRLKESHNPRSAKEIIDGRIVNKDLLDEAVTVLFAGQDTSAATLSWTLHLLSLNPNVQRLLANEIHRVLEKNGIVHDDSKMISKKLIRQMPYLDAVIKESMRLYPVAPFVVRKITHDFTIPGESNNEEKVTFPKDTLACIWIYCLHRNKRFWHCPHSFIPERWIDPDIQKLDAAQTTFKFAFLPFAAGPRNCVGQPLAHTILRIMLAKIIVEFRISDLRLAENQSEKMVPKGIQMRKDMQAGFTILPAGGVSLAFSNRLKKE